MDMSDPHEERSARSSGPGFHWLMRLGRLSHSDMNLPQASLHRPKYFRTRKIAAFNLIFLQGKKEKKKKGKVKISSTWAHEEGNSGCKSIGLFEMGHQDYYSNS